MVPSILNDLGVLMPEGNSSRICHAIMHRIGMIGQIVEIEFFELF